MLSSSDEQSLNQFILDAVFASIEQGVNFYGFHPYG